MKPCGDTVDRPQFFGGKRRPPLGLQDRQACIKRLGGPVTATIMFEPGGENLPGPGAELVDQRGGHALDDPLGLMPANGDTAAPKVMSGRLNHFADRKSVE